MPPGYTSAQKSAIMGFVSFTQENRATAAKCLKEANWNVEVAVNAYFNASTGTTSANPAVLGKLFDKYRDEPKEKPDEIGVSGTMQYLQDLEVSIEDLGMLLVSELLKSPSMGTITREGFITGWSSKSCDTLQAQKRHIADSLESLPKNKDSPIFEAMYKHTFLMTRPVDQRALPLDDAIEYWRLLFSSSLSPMQWKTANSPWLDWWIEFLQSKWKKSINKDLWVQTYKFAKMCINDASMQWWNEDSAWPGVIDEFVEWVTEKRKADSEMEIE